MHLQHISPDLTDLRGISVRHNITDTWTPKLTNLLSNQLFKSPLRLRVCDVSYLFYLPVFPPPSSCLSACHWLSGGAKPGVVFGSPRGSQRPWCCRITFTPGERWELWEQSVLVCWRRPACSVLRAWVWAKGWHRGGGESGWGFVCENEREIREKDYCQWE